jgi:methionine-rich copper-binding protein CopC
MGKNNVMAPIVGKMADGKYTVSWQTAGDDGHVQKGTFSFTLKH